MAYLLSIPAYDKLESSSKDRSDCFGHWMSEKSRRYPFYLYDLLWLKWRSAKPEFCPPKFCKTFIFVMISGKFSWYFKMIKNNFHWKDECCGFVPFLQPQFLPVMLGAEYQGAVQMSYISISIDREALTIMDVPFPSLEAWERAAMAIGSNMFEGYEPTKPGIEIIRDYATDKLSFDEFIRAAMDKSYAK